MPKKVRGFSFISPKDAMELSRANGFQALFLANRSFKVSRGSTSRGCNLLPAAHGVPNLCGWFPYNSLTKVDPKSGTTLTNHERWWQIQLHTSFSQSQKILCNSIFGGGWNTNVFTMHRACTLYKKALRDFGDIWGLGRHDFLKWEIAKVKFSLDRSTETLWSN